MSYFDTDGIKRRREERVRRLREQMEDTYSSYFFEDDSQIPLPYQGEEARPWQDEPEWLSSAQPNYPSRMHHPSEEPYSSHMHHRHAAHFSSYRKKPVRRTGRDKWFIRIVVSFCLLSAAYGIRYGQFNGADKYRAMLNDVMKRSYDFQAMSAWYEKKFGAVPMMLPSIGPLGNQAKPVLEPKTTLLKAPAPGKVVKTYAEQGNGLYFTPQNPVINSIDKGWITFAGVKDGLGKTVIIEHARGMETWYGGLGEISVSVNDWVDAQHPIGKALQDGKTSKPVYFAVKKEGGFVNPQEVVRFE